MLLKLGYGLSTPCNNKISEGGPPLLSDIFGINAVFELDATLSDSYPGTGQTWSNVIASPADGSDQGEYNAFLGDDGTADTSDPTFTGTAGDSAAYFSYDGGDGHFFDHSSLPTMFADMHKGTSGKKWWMTIAFRTPSSLSANATLFDARSVNGTQLLYINFNTSFRVIINGGDGNTIFNFHVGSVATDTDYLVIVSYDFDNSKLTTWVNSATGGDLAGQATGTDESGITTAGLMQDTGGSQQWPDGTRLYGFYGGWDVHLDDTKAGEIISLLETRHNRDYTP